MGLALAMGLSTGSAMGCGDDEEPAEPREAMAGRVGDVLPVVMPADAPLPADRDHPRASGRTRPATSGRVLEHHTPSWVHAEARRSGQIRLG